MTNADLSKEFLEASKAHWKRSPDKSMYHYTLTLLIDRYEKPHNLGLSLYGQLLRLLSPSYKEISPEALSSLSNEQLRNIGLPSPAISCIRAVTALGDKLSLNSIPAVKGLGSSTIRALQVLFFTEPDLDLVENILIRRRLSELKGLRRTCTIQEAKNFFQQWEGYRSLVSLFLWRIKSQGIDKIRKDEVLTREDFYQP